MYMKKRIEILTIGLIIGGFLLIGLGTVVFLWGEISDVTIKQEINSEKFGQLGDFIGGTVGAFWALAGVLLFYLALKEQRKDIKINQDSLENQVTALNQQIKEFNLQTKELEQTKQVFIEQAETLKIQRFENTFFQLLQFNQEIIDKLWLNNSFSFDPEEQTSYEKRSVLSKSVIILKNCLDTSLKEWTKTTLTSNPSYVDIKIANIDEAYSKLIEAYNDFYFEGIDQLLSHYFRNTYHIFKFIYKSELINEDKKQFYASLARAHLSSDELFLIFYNVLIEGLGKPNFLFLVKEFDLLQNFDFNLVETFDYHKDIYDRELNVVNPIF